MRSYVFAAAVLLLVAAVQSRAQQEQVSGKFTSYVAGRPIATESYTLTAAADGTLRAEAELSPEGGTRQRLVTVASRSGPASFTAEVGGQKIYEAQFTGAGVVKLQHQGRAPVELRTKADVILENLVWHQFHFLLPRYDHARGGRQTFTFFSPSNERDFQIEIERTGAPVFSVGGKQLKTESYRMTAAGLTFEMWTDERRTPLLFRLAAQQLKAVHTGFEELEKLARAEAAPTPPPLKTPDYVTPSSFTEREVTVGADTAWPLPATLSLPATAGPHPAVVLVHGSGPNDRDETIGASKPFRDIAWGLASRGVAALRYDKRTRVHGARISASKEPFTVREETVDDALAAADLLRRTPGIDARSIFVLGHSLGGGLIPRIAERDAKLRGFVILAGYTRGFLDETLRQYEYLFNLDGQLSERERALLEEARRDAARLKELTPADAAAGVKLQGIPAAYWLDLRDYSPTAEARKLDRPVLVLQGERDYNVTMEAFADWRRALAGSKRAAFKSYPKLDHAFLEGEGPASDADYRQPRNVARQVVEDIAGWLKNN